MAPVTKPRVDLGPTFMRAWRDYRGVDQQEASEAANISRTLLSKIENGRSPYLQQHIEALAKLYRCRPVDRQRLA